MEHLDAITAAGGLSSGGAVPAQSLENAVRDALDEATRTNQISEVSNDMRTAIQLQSDASPVETNLENLMETKPGALNGEMDRLVGGTAPAEAETDVNLDAMDQMTDRIRTVYLDLANFTVAWKIVNTSRQDLSRLLTSS